MSISTHALLTVELAKCFKLLQEFTKIILSLRERERERDAHGCLTFFSKGVLI